MSPIKKAAANAAAKVRRWIKELQINVSEHGVMNRIASIHLDSVANGAGSSHTIASRFQAVHRESPARIRP
jgi:hypothetical protein